MMRSVRSACRRRLREFLLRKLRGVRLFREQQPEYNSDNAAHKAIASKLGAFKRPETPVSATV